MLVMTPEEWTRDYRFKFMENLISEYWCWMKELFKPEMATTAGFSIHKQPCWDFIEESQKKSFLQNLTDCWLLSSQSNLSKRQLESARIIFCASMMIHLSAIWFNPIHQSGRKREEQKIKASGSSNHSTGAEVANYWALWHVRNITGPGFTAPSGQKTDCRNELSH